MTTPAPGPKFEHAFHRSAERHERIWIFCVVTMLALLAIGTMFYAVYDYGVVTKGTSFHADPTAPAREAAFRDGRVIRTGPNAYSVYMVGHLWMWSPSPIHVKQGAAITFYVTSTDVLHGFEVQGTTINLTAVPGIVGAVTYSFSHPGTYHIICNEFCGIEHQAMIGRIIVDPAARA